MTEEMIALARRAVACKGWRWMPGMLFVRGNGTRIRLVVELGTHAIGVVQGGGHPSWREPLPLAGVLPNLTDPATLGCLLALYEETRTTLSCPDPVYTYAAAYGLLHPKTLEALVAALEAAP